MVTGEKYHQELVGIKRLLQEYRILETDQLYAYYPSKERAILHQLIIKLKCLGQIYLSEDGKYAAIHPSELKPEPDQKLIACFWTLLRFVGALQYHMRAKYPAVIYFMMEGQDFAIIYVAAGDENLMESLLRNSGDPDLRYIIVVDHEEQIGKLSIPQAAWYCTVDHQGKLTRYIQED